MKVLFFSHQAQFIYGGEVCTLAFMEELGKRGVEVHFASPLGPYQERAKKFATCHTVPSQQFSRNFLHLFYFLPALLSTIRCLSKIMKSNDIKILHATSLKAMVYAWWLGASRSVIWHHHDILPAGRANSWWLKFLSSRAKLILIPSKATKDALEEAGVDPEKCSVLYNGFSIEDWAIRKPRESSLKFRVALVGEISSRKGIDRLPGIIRSLNERGGMEGIEFVIIGDALTSTAFASEVRQTLKGQPVTFLGRREDVKQILQNVDLLLVPSRQDPLPTVIVEASLSGVPAVGSTVGGIPEMITDGENGFLANADEEYADAIFLARELSNWARLSHGARVRAEKSFDIRRQTEELILQYEKIYV